MGAKVELVRIEGPTSIYVDAEINEVGDLILSGQDVGEVPWRCSETPSPGRSKAWRFCQASASLWLHSLPGRDLGARAIHRTWRVNLLFCPRGVGNRAAAIGTTMSTLTRPKAVPFSIRSPALRRGRPGNDFPAP